MANIVTVESPRKFVNNPRLLRENATDSIKVFITYNDNNMPTVFEAFYVEQDTVLVSPIYTQQVDYENCD